MASGKSGHVSQCGLGTGLGPHRQRSSSGSITFQPGYHTPPAGPQLPRPYYAANSAASRDNILKCRAWPMGKSQKEQKSQLQTSFRGKEMTVNRSNRETAGNRPGFSWVLENSLRAGMAGDSHEKTQADRSSFHHTGSRCFTAGQNAALRVDTEHPAAPRGTWHQPATEPQLLPGSKAQPCLHVAGRPEPATSPLWCPHFPHKSPDSPSQTPAGGGKGGRTELGWNTYLSRGKEKINVIVKRRAVLSFVCEVSCTERFISHEISPSCSPTPAAQ